MVSTFSRVWHETEGKPFKSKLEYTLGQSRFWTNALWWTAIALWLIQELGLRAKLPESGYPTINRLFDILATLYGAFVTGYSFYWMVEFAPRMHRQYNRQVEFEYALISLLGRFRDFVYEMLEPHQRDTSVTENLFLTWDWDHPPKVIDLMLSAQENGTDRWGNVGRIDSFIERYAFTCEQLERLTRELGEVKIDMDEDLQLWVKMASLWTTNVNDTMEASRMTLTYRRMDYLPMCNNINVFYDHLSKIVHNHSYITPHIPILFNKCRYQSVWDDIESDAAKRLAMKERLAAGRG